MNAVELLKEQHRKVDSLFKQFQKAKSTEEKEKIFLELASCLVGHDAIEREIFYPECQKALGPIERLLEGIAEHGLMEFSIFRADKARKKPTFDYLVRVLAEIVEHHVAEEEREILPKAGRKMGNALLERLGKAMQERFEAVTARDFRRPLRQNLEQVLAGRARTTPPKRAARPARRKPATTRTPRKAAAGTKRAGARKRSAHAS